MAIYKTRWFDRWARKQGLTTPSLCTAIREIANGLYDADLGGGLFKKRIARPGQGKRGGFRTLVATNTGNRWFFVFGFPDGDGLRCVNGNHPSLKPSTRRPGGCTRPA